MLPILELLLNPKRTLKRHRRQHSISQEAKKRPCRIVIGASGVVPNGWCHTEIDDVNLLDESTWVRFFENESIDAILAEHVWEHITEDEGRTAASTCFRFLKPGGYLRVAVPDGFHPSTKYLDWTRPGGTGAGADDHKVLYTHRTFAELFESVGFTIRELEYFDEDRCFQFNEWSPNDGMIHRSLRYDPRNTDGEVNYTSLILDATKPAQTARSQDAA